MTGLQQRLRTASVQAGLESLEIDVVDQALPPANPVLRPQSTIILTALVFSLLGGIVVAFLMESLDTGLRSIAEIESITELPSLAIIPRARRSSADQAGTLIDGAAQYQHSDAAEVAVCRGVPFAAHVAAALDCRASAEVHCVYQRYAIGRQDDGGEQSGGILAQRDTRVLLIDGDLRRPNIHHRFGLNGKVGLTTVLTGATKLEETVQHVPEIPNLDILPSGPVPPFPTEMLSSEAMEAILKRCGELYDYVVIDSPPILSVTDGVILARAGGCGRAGGASRQVEQACGAAGQGHSAALGCADYRYCAECCGSEFAGVLRVLRVLGILVLERGFRELGVAEGLGDEARKSGETER